MKKLLALVLALVMTLGLATVSTSAAYDDAADINYDEAVDVMTAVGVFQGKGNSFDPKANLNRAEAAKIVAYLMLGNDAAEAIKGTGSKFTDVPASHWASGYIEYLASAGVLSGVGGGKFDPNGQVTAIQLAKMLLGALGYDAEIEGFVGSDWAINIQKVANKVGIYDGNDNVVGNNAVTRDEAALYAFNTVCSPMVEYDTTTTVNIGDANVKIGSNNWKYMTTGSSSARYDNIDDARTNDNNQAKIIEFGEQQWSTLVRDSDNTDSFGRAKVIWEYKGNQIGEYVDRSDLIFSASAKVQKSALYELFGSSDFDHLKDGDTDKATLAVWLDGEKLELGTDYLLSDFLAKNNSTAAGMSEKGIVTEVYKDTENDYNEYTIIQFSTWLVQATADYNTSRESVTVEVKDTNAGDSTANNSYYTLNGENHFRHVPAGMDTTIEAEDFPNVKDVKADDYLLVTWSNDKKEYGTVDVAKTLTGKVTQYTTTSNVYIDGEKKEYNIILGSADDDHEKAVEYTINENATVVLDNYGWIIYVDEALSTNSYVFIRKAADVSGLGTTVKADAYFLDGTSKEITVKKVGTTTVDGVGDVDMFSWYTYTVDSNGEYSLKYAGNNTWAVSLANEQDKTETAIANGKVSFLNTGYMVNSTAIGGDGREPLPGIEEAQIGNDPSLATPAYVNERTQFIVYDHVDKDITVYTGIANFPDIKISKDAALGDVSVAYAKADNDGYYKLVFVDLGDHTDADENNDTATYMMLLKTTGNTTVLEDTKYYEYKVLLDGKEETKFIDEDELEDATGLIDENNDDFNGFYSKIGAGQLFTKVKENSKGYIYKGTYMSGEKAKEWDIELSAGALSTIKQSGNSVIFEDVAGVRNDSETNIPGADTASFVVPSSANVNLIVHKTAPQPLLKVKGADYELHLNLTANGLAGLLKDYYLTGKVYAVVTDDNGERVTNMYVWISGATPKAVADAEVVYDTELKYIASSKADNTLTLRYYVEDPDEVTPDDEDILALLTEAGYTNVATNGMSWSMKKGALTYTNLTVTPVRVYKVAANAVKTLTPATIFSSANWTLANNSVKYLAVNDTFTVKLTAKAVGEFNLNELNLGNTTGVDGLTAGYAVTTTGTADTKAVVTVTYTAGAAFDADVAAGEIEFKTQI